MGRHDVMVRYSQNLYAKSGGLSRKFSKGQMAVTI